MDPTSLVASGIGGIAGLIGTEQTNQANAQMASANQAFQEQMSDTAYQRQVTDMKAAGLNPMFAVGSGGASTPTGSVAQQQSPLSGALTGAETGLDAANKYRQQQNMDDQQELNKKMTASNIAKNVQDIATSGAQKENLEASAKNTNTQTLTEQGDVPAAQIKYKLYNKVLNPIIDSISNQMQDSAQKYPSQNVYDATERMDRKFNPQKYNKPSWNMFQFGQ